MSEFRPLSNKDIRRQARSLLRSNFGRIFGLGLLMMAIAMIPTLMMETMIEILITSELGMFMYQVVNIVVMVLLLGMSIGFLQVCRNIWNGEPAGVGTLFSKFKRIPRALGISFIMGALVMVVYIPMIIVLMIGAFMPEEMAGLMVVLMILVIIALFIAIIWAELRFSLATFCIVVRPELGIFECLRASWIATKGKVWRVFCHSIMLSLPVVGVMFAVMLVFGLIAAMLDGAAFGAFIVVTMIVTVLIASAAEGYLMLGQYGLAEYLLNGAETGVRVLDNYGVWPAPEQPAPSGHFEDFQPEPIALPGEPESTQPEEIDEDDYNPDEDKTEEQ